MDYSYIVIALPILIGFILGRFLAISAKFSAFIFGFGLTIYFLYSLFGRAIDRNLETLFIAGPFVIVDVVIYSAFAYWATSIGNTWRTKSL
jgi:hypothetical protein